MWSVRDPLDMFRHYNPVIVLPDGRTFQPRLNHDSSVNSQDAITTSHSKCDVRVLSDHIERLIGKAAGAYKLEGAAELVKTAIVELT